MGKLHDAVRSGNVTDVKKYLTNRNVNDREGAQQTALHIACSTPECPAEIVNLLIKKKADVNVQDKNGWTPFHCCTKEGKLDVCETLLNLDGIDVTGVTKDGTSALHYLVRLMVQPEQTILYKYVLNLYLQKLGWSLNIDCQSKHGEAAIHQACYYGNTTAVKYLLEHKANINITNLRGETPLHNAVRTGRAQIIEMLIEKNADINVKSQDGTPAEIAPTDEIRNLVKGNSAASNSEDEKPLKDFRLKIRVMSARNLSTPDSAKAGCKPFVQLTYDNEKKTTAVKKGESPKWGEVFLFNLNEEEEELESLKLSIYHQENNQPPTKEDLMGQLLLRLNELDVDRSGKAKPLRGWHTLKKKPKKSNKTPKIRLEISLILISELEDNGEGSNLPPAPNNNNNENSGGSGSVFGFKRGKCKVSDCDCGGYKTLSESGGPCLNCGHYPAQHVNLGKEKETTPEVPEVEKKEGGGGGGIDSLGTTVENIQKEFKTGGSGNLSHNWEINATELQFTKRLGEGTNATVFRGTYRNQQVAIKVLKEQAEKKGMEEFEKEFEIMSSLRSPNVVFFYGACIKPSLCMVLEFCDKGALFDVLNDLNVDVHWRRVFKFALDTVKGINCLHNWVPEIVHRDLKSLNLLVDENWAVKVADFGTARFTAGDPSNLDTLGKLRGTYAYAAPEVYFGQDFTPKSDIFSCGIILWELAYRCITGTYEQPYAEYKHIVFDFQIIIQTAKNNLRPTIPENCPAAFKSIIERCWDPTPDNRPDTKELQQLLRDAEEVYYDNKPEWDNLRTPADPNSNNNNN